MKGCWRSLHSSSSRFKNWFMESDTVGELPLSAQLEHVNTLKLISGNQFANGIGFQDDS
jgi:hypothetical protein